MAPTIFFILIVGLLIFAAARLYGRRPYDASPPDTFLEDRLSKLMSADLVDEVRTYANRTEQTVQEVIDEALREFLRRRREEERDDPMNS
jgi:hypothetical protein